MDSFATPLGSTITQAAAQVFYVIRNTGATAPDNYVRRSQTDYTYQGGFDGARRFAEAERFKTVGEVLTVFADRDREYRMFNRDEFQIVRVEEHTTVGTKRRIEVPLGDKRQTGVAIRAWKGATCYYSGVPTDGLRFAHDLTGARVYPGLGEAAYALQLAAVAQKYTICGNPEFIGIAEETTPGTTKYTETVLA